MAKLEVDFVRAGGTLLVGTDPTGGGGVIPGYSESARARAARRSGAHAARGDQGRHAERRDVPRPRRSSSGSIAVGKQADLVVIDGDPSTRIEDIRKVMLVFKQGVGYDPAKLIASVKGRVGLF